MVDKQNTGNRQKIFSISKNSLTQRFVSRVEPDVNLVELRKQMEYQLEAANKDSDTSSDNSNTSQQAKELVTDPENDEKEGTVNTEKIPNELPEKFVFLKSVGRHFALVSFTLYACFLCFTYVLFLFRISFFNA